MRVKEIIIKNKTGLHARPAADFVHLAQQFKCEIKVIKDNKVVNGKSIIGVISLGAGAGSKIVIQAEGDDEDKAIEELAKVLQKEK